MHYADSPVTALRHIRQIVRLCALDPGGDESFRALILRYGGEDASQKYKPPVAKNKTLACDLHLPVFDTPLIEPWPMKMSWEDAVRNFAATHEHYMRNFDSPEKRWRDKNSARFRLPAD